MSNKIAQRTKRRKRIRSRFSGTSQRPRVSVFRSNSHIYVQVIDDQTHITLVGVSDKALEKEVKSKVSRSLELGKLIAKNLGEKKIKSVVFDRGGYRYHGRVKAVADGLREGGLTV